MSILYLDCEYSSFFSPDKKKSGELLQLAIEPVVDGVVMDEKFNEYCRPLTNMWSSHAEKIHGITREFAMAQQHPKEMAQKLYEYVAKFESYFTACGHNAKGDKSYTERLMNDYDLTLEWHTRVKHTWRDTHTRAKNRAKLLPVKSLTLGSLCKYFGIKINAHDALSDAIATRKLDEHLTLLRTDIGQFQQNAISNMSYIDKRVKFLDLSYLVINGDGDVFISAKATKDPEALKFVLEELWNVYIDSDA